MSFLRRTHTAILTGSAPPRLHGKHRPDHFVEIGSLTKVLTGTALQRLAHDGVLGLDDPLEQWLQAPPGTGITLRTLAEHTSGLPRLPPHTGPRQDPYLAFDSAALQSVVSAADELVTSAPGTAKVYSNLGYALLGAALVSAAQMPYEALVRHFVLDPLGIDDFTAHPPEDRRLTGTGLWGGPRAPWTMDGPILPAGGMWATPFAVADLTVALLRDEKFGPPALAWQQQESLIAHNGATRDASVFAGFHRTTGEWAVVHRVNGDPDGTDRTGLKLLLGREAGSAA